MTRNGPAGIFLAIFGPVHPPTRKPAASGATSTHLTSPNNAKHTAAMAFAIPETAFFTAFTLTNVSCASKERDPWGLDPVTWTGHNNVHVKLRSLGS